MEILLGWILLSVVVGVAAASHRNRSGVGWFFLALLISPLFAGLLVLALPKAGQSNVIKRSELAARILQLQPGTKIDQRWSSQQMATIIAQLEAEKAKSAVHPGWKNLSA